MVMVTARKKTTGEDLRGGTITAMQVLATSLATHLTLEELEWLWRELAKRAEQKGPRAGGAGQEPLKGSA